jgi:glycosyltransferase involved in cell wall biosynthesis
MNISQSSSKDIPLLSIITVCFNSATTIRDTLNSVRQQKDSRFEYIVIDGGSNDGTVEILQDNLNIIDVFISEKDNGIYDAMNKGLQLSNGRFVLNLNSDDYLAENAISVVLCHLENLVKMEWCILTGITKIVNCDKSEVARLKLTHKSYANRFKYNPFPHPSTIISRDILSKCNGFNSAYRIASDYDMFLRASLLHPKIYFIDDVISNMRSGGISDESQKLSILITHQLELYKIQSSYISNIKSIYYLAARLSRVIVKKIIQRSILIRYL